MATNHDPVYRIAHTPSGEGGGRLDITMSRLPPAVAEKIILALHRLAPDARNATITGDPGISLLGRTVEHAVAKQRKPRTRTTTIPWVRITSTREGAFHDGLRYDLGKSGEGKQGGWDLRITWSHGPTMLLTLNFNPNTAGREWFVRKTDALAAAQEMANARAEQLDPAARSA